jgi:ribosomal protein S18 acetylase RimI-like enzyme
VKISLSEINVSELKEASEIDAFPQGITFFEPYLKHDLKETLESGGEAYLSRSTDGVITGLFMYDEYEEGGTIYTKSREVFDQFYRLKEFSYLYSELKTEHPNQAYDICTMNIEKARVVPTHKFKNRVTLIENEVDEIERFMVEVSPGMNQKWVRVALDNGDICSDVRIGDRIVGMGWASLVGDVGRVHTLFVKPQFRRMGIARDLLYARLTWLKSRHARSVFAEISHDNIASLDHVMKMGMMVSGQVFEYFNEELGDMKAIPKLTEDEGS